MDLLIFLLLMGTILVSIIFMFSIMLMGYSISAKAIIYFDKVIPEYKAYSNVLHFLVYVGLIIANVSATFLTLVIFELLMSIHITT